MSPETVLSLIRGAIELTLLMAAPMLAVSLVVGVILSVIQAATQIQEPTLTFVPKIVAMFLTLLLTFPWLLDKMSSYTRELITSIPNYLR